MTCCKDTTSKHVVDESGDPRLGFCLFKVVIYAHAFHDAVGVSVTVHGLENQFASKVNFALDVALRVSVGIVCGQPVTVPVLTQDSWSGDL